MVCKKWSEEEINNIIIDLKSNPINSISSKYKRTNLAIYNKLKSLNIDFSNIEYSNWTEEQENCLKEKYSEYTYNQLVKILDKDICDIKFKSKKLKLGKKSSNPKMMNKKTPSKFVPPHKWTNAEDQYLIKNFKLLSFCEMESTLNLTRKAIYSRANKLGLKRDNIRIKKDSFTIYELETLKIYYNKIPMKELLKLLPRKNEDQINRKAKNLKLHKIRQTLPEEKVENILIELKLNYEQQTRFNFGEKYYLCDFKVENKYIIEVQGDYWHGNPKLYDNDSLNELQKEMIKRDIDKKYELEQLGYKVIYIWEYDLIHNYEDCKSILNTLLQ